MTGPVIDCTTLEVTFDGPVARVALNRPDVHNAFDETLIAELTHVVRTLDADAGMRVVIIEGRGKSFCAGADLNWMQKMAAFSQSENLADASALAAMLSALNNLSKPTIARVHGAALGGGVGLVACCDIAIGSPGATFALSETRLGLIPAAISPYVIEAIGSRAARRYFISAERFGAEKAHQLGLLHELVPESELDATVDRLVAALLEAGPQAQAEAKLLIRAVAHRPIDQGVIGDTAKRIARIRATPEGKEGVAAFLAKRKPAWRAHEK
ncbi:MAG: enoyl-CoA hydratase/isomerase family protein [Pseudomonadota bacterium]|nr:enoyl-CoA hydratase/isomerase family protein [Pseudomonadota bacterium]